MPNLLSKSQMNLGWVGKDVSWPVLKFISLCFSPQWKPCQNESSRVATCWKSKMDPLEYIKLKIQKHVSESF